MIPNPDEAPEPVRGEMITALNRTLSAGDRMLLTCRSAEFVAAVEAAEDVVTAAAVIELERPGAFLASRLRRLYVRAAESYWWSVRCTRSSAFGAARD